LIKPKPKGHLIQLAIMEDYSYVKYKKENITKLMSQHINPTCIALCLAFLNRSMSLSVTPGGSDDRLTLPTNAPSENERQ
jgi:hypothetical protein